MNEPNDDDPWQEAPRCIYCGNQIRYGSTAVEICVGEFLIGKKSGLPYFAPWDNFPDGETVKLIHSYCLHTLMDFVDEKEGGLFRCNLCAEELSQNPELYRLRIGKVVDTGDQDFWDFEPSKYDQSTTFLCADCMLEGIGEGDFNAGCALLGMG